MNHEEKIVEIINRIKINRKIVKNIRESVMAECMASSKYVEAQTLFRENRPKNWGTKWNAYDISFDGYDVFN